MKFVFITQTDRMSNYTGPSGITYLIHKGEPFNVENEKDIEFFKKNKRFQKATKKDKKEISKAPEELLEIKLKEIDVTEDTIKKSTDLYRSVEELEDVVLQNYELDPSIPKEDAEKIIQNIKGD